MMTKEVQEEYDNFWKDIVEKDGVLDKEAVMNELADYKVLLHNVPIVYSHVTHGRISKQLTDADVVCSVADDCVTDLVNEAIEDYKEELQDREVPYYNWK